MRNEEEKKAYNAYMKEYMRKYSMNRKARVVALLGGVCIVCGTDQDLQVHHKDPATKSFTLATRWHRKWEETEAEIAKCELLCGPCHRDHHRPKDTPPCGTIQGWWRGCRCSPCLQAKKDYSREYSRERRRKLKEAKPL